MRKIKVLVVLLLILCGLVITTPKTMALTTYNFEPEAWHLYHLGLYSGASQYSFYPDLGATLDRQVGATLLLNFFGERNEVLALQIPEIDTILSQYKDQSSISNWARPYMAYAVKTGVIVGTSTTTLSPLSPIDGLSYATMILRRLGYTVDRQAFPLSIQTLYNKGGINALDVALFNKVQFLKNDAVGMVYTTLYAQCSDGKTLLEKLVLSGAVSADKVVSLKLARYTNPDNIEVIKPLYRSIPRPTVYDQVYFGVLEALISASPDIKLIITPFTDTAEEVFDLVERCVRDNPEILYYSGCTYSSNGLLTFQYSKSAVAVKAHTVLLKERLDTLSKELIRADMTDYQKELAIHNYIIENCDYDVYGYNSSQIPSESYSAYGVLCLGTAVCEGYAEATKLLLNRAGVESIIMTGSSKGEGHAWNLVKIDGQYYQLDVTWDDPVMADGSEALSYHYFNVTDKEMSLDHEWDKTAYPLCEATESNYYVYNKLVVPNQEEFINLVVGTIQKGDTEISVKILDFKTNGFNSNQAIETVCNRLFRSCSYYFNAKYGIMDMTFN